MTDRQRKAPAKLPDPTLPNVYVEKGLGAGVKIMPPPPPPPPPLPPPSDVPRIYERKGSGDIGLCIVLLGILIGLLIRFHS
jgi:hypothetical protein